MGWEGTPYPLLLSPWASRSPAKGHCILLNERDQEKQAGKQGRETEAQRVIDGGIEEGGAKEKQGQHMRRSVTKPPREKTTRMQRKRGEEGAIQRARRQKDCGEGAGVP